MLFEQLVTIVITIFVLIIVFYKWRFQYWKRKGFQYLEPRIPYGNLGSVFKKKEHIGLIGQDLYKRIKQKGWKHGGIFGFFNPIYMVTDLEYVKNVMAKDFEYFADRGLYRNEKGDPLSGHLFNIDGPKWRNLRTKLTPTFTSGKMKSMFAILIQCECNLHKSMQKYCDNKMAVDIKDVLGCFTTDIIGSCAFGLECKSFEQDNSPFRIYGKKIFERNTFRSVKRQFANTLPAIAKFFNVKLIPQDINDFFITLVKDTVEHREKNAINRYDFLQILIELKNNDKNFKFTIEELAAQCFVFFLAGFETSSTAMTFALYELARNQEMQHKARQEIQTILRKHDGQMTYDALQEMKYVGQIIDESLRMYPPAPILPRKCKIDYKIPEMDLVLEKGTLVFIPVLGIHRDEEYYPDPEKFNPDRFNEENKNKRRPYSFIPFGEGPRICIGLRFGIMQSKMGLASLLSKFKFTLNAKTQEPLEMKTNSTVLAAKGEIWLNVYKSERY